MIDYNKAQLEDCHCKLIEVTCNFCKNIFLNERRLVQRAIREKTLKFCNRVCLGKYNRISQNIYNCKECNKEVKRLASSISETGNVFCDHICSANFVNRPRSEAARAKNKIVCLNCQKECYYSPYQVNTKKFCSRSCKLVYQHPKENHYKKCQFCEKDFRIESPSQLKRKFCSGTCRNKFNNKSLIGSRSKAERVVEKAIHQEFPNLEIRCNDRIILDGRELDFYIPSLRMAIEWNGIFHQKVIRNQNQFEKIQLSDKEKRDKCDELNIKLIVVNDWTSDDVFINKETQRLISLISEEILKQNLQTTDKYVIVDNS